MWLAAGQPASAGPLEQILRLLPAARPPPLRLDPSAVERRRPETIRVYRRALGIFTVWLQRHGLEVDSAFALDDLLVEWRLAENIGRATFAHAVAAAELANPQFKGMLSWTHQVQKDLVLAAPSTHHIPLPWRLAVLIAAVLAAAGFGRLGAGLLVQHCRGLRPGELLALRGRDIMLPEDRTLSNGAVAVLNLGMKAGTKARRAQCTTIVASNAPVAMCALRALAASTPKEQLILFGYNLGAYQRLLGRCCEVLGLPGFTPHSPRAGFATDAWLAGVDFVSIREAGRWLADSSLRVYLDGVSTASLESSPTAAAWAPLAAWIEAHFGAVFPWWPATSWVPTAPLPPVLLEAAARLQSRKRRP